MCFRCCEDVNQSRYQLFGALRACVCAQGDSQPSDWEHTHTSSHTMFPSRAVKIVPDKKRRKVKHAKMTWNEMGNGAALLFCAHWVDFTVI